MKIYRVQDFVVKGKEVFLGLEDSKRTWKIAVRSERMLIHEYAPARTPPRLRALPQKSPRPEKCHPTRTIEASS